MTTTYEIYANEDGTPVAVTGGSSGTSPAIVERVESLETSVENLETSVETAQATADACLPLAGGTVTGVIYGEGGIIRGKTDASDVWISGGTNSSSNSYIQINGGSRTNQAGDIIIVTKTPTGSYSLRATASGALTWGGKDVITSAGGTMTGSITSSANEAMVVTRGEGNAYIGRAERTDTGHALLFGIGAGGTNRGIFDSATNKWMIYLDENGVLKTGGSNIVYITNSWHNSEQWYRKWSDGFVEQGGVVAYSNSSGTTITYHTAYAGKPTVTFNAVGSDHAEYTLNAISNTNFSWKSNTPRTGWIIWHAAGY